MKLTQLLSIIDEMHIKHNTSVPMICGGIPRDKYMNRIDNVNDIDITTGDASIHMLANEVLFKLRQNYLVKSETAKDGHQTIMFDKTKIDFSSNFRMPNIDFYLHKNGIEINDLNGEMLSRDFTCNAMLLKFDLNTILDPTNMGIKDINNKIIRTCLEPNVTLTANKNRVIRSIYLACKLDFSIDKNIIEYVKANPKSLLLSNMSGLSEKLNKSLDLDADKVIYYLNVMNLWNVIPITEKLYPYKVKYA